MQLVNNNGFPKKKMLNFDNQITTAINSLTGRNVALDFAAIFLAKHVIFLLVLSIAVSWFARSDRATWRFRAISCCLAVTVGLLLNQGILLFLSRVRPYDLGLTHIIAEKSADPSFPSDHATVAFAIALMLILVRDRFAIPYLILAAFVALARVFVGLHFFSDVAGGAMTALIGTVVVRKLYKSNSRLNDVLTRFL